MTTDQLVTPPIYLGRYARQDALIQNVRVSSSAEALVAMAGVLDVDLAVSGLGVIVRSHFNASGHDQPFVEAPVDTVYIPATYLDPDAKTGVWPTKAELLQRHKQLMEVRLTDWSTESLAQQTATALSEPPFAPNKFRGQLRRIAIGLGGAVLCGEAATYEPKFGLGVVACLAWTGTESILELRDMRREQRVIAQAQRFCPLIVTNAQTA